MAKSGAGVINEIEPDVMRDISDTLVSLRNMGKPQTDAEIKNRIDTYFDACRNSAVRPGIEGLSMALCVTRETLRNWANQVGCSAERAEYVRQAKQYILAILENLGLQNKVYPATMIFCLKNWADYKDTPQQLEIVSERPFMRSQAEILAGINSALLEESEDNYDN